MRQFRKPSKEEQYAIEKTMKDLKKNQELMIEHVKEEVTKELKQYIDDKINEIKNR